jgi:hypothetical protein
METVLTSQQLTEAAELAKQIETLKVRLQGILGGTVEVTKSGMSDAAKAKIGQAQKRRWRKYHEAKAAAAAATSAPVAPTAVAA